MNKRLLWWLRKRLPQVVLVGGVCALAACASMGTPQASLAACQALLPITNSATQLKPQLPPAVQAQVGLGLATAIAYCQMPNPPANANAVVAGILNSVQTLMNQILQDKINQQHPVGA